MKRRRLGVHSSPLPLFLKYSVFSFSLPNILLVIRMKLYCCKYNFIYSCINKLLPCSVICSAYFLLTLSTLQFFKGHSSADCHVFPVDCSFYLILNAIKNKHSIDCNPILNFCSIIYVLSVNRFYVNVLLTVAKCSANKKIA